MTTLIICSRCSKSKEMEEFGKGRRECRLCQTELGLLRTEAHRKLIDEIIAAKGGCCEECGFTGRLQFCHKVPSEKKIHVSGQGSNMLSHHKIREEADKCRILCQACHKIETVLQGQRGDFQLGGPRKPDIPTVGRNQVCIICERRQDLSFFYSKKKSSNGFTAECKDCVRKTSAAFRKSNKDFIDSHKTICSMPGCNETRGLEFNHIDPNQKKFCISAMTSLSRTRIIEELAKCEVLCYTCHKENTIGQHAKKRLEGYARRGQYVSNANKRPIIGIVVSTNETILYDSISSAEEAGYKNITLSIQTGKVRSGVIWSFNKDNVAEQIKKPKPMFDRLPSLKCKPVLGVNAADGSIIEFASVQSAKKLGYHNIPRGIKTGRPQHGYLWSYIIENAEYNPNSPSAHRSNGSKSSFNLSLISEI